MPRAFAVCMLSPNRLSLIPRFGLLAAGLACIVSLAACDTEAMGTDDDSADTDDGPFDDLGKPALPRTALDYGHDLPDHFDTDFVTDSDNTPGDNAVSDAGATLGRVLFWDRRLSQNGTVACGSCHAPGAGYSDNAALSEGFDGDRTGRNSMSLANARWYERGAMFWDERAASLEDQVLMPIQDAAEMGMTLDELVERVEAEDFYRPLFTAAFGDERVSSERISMALAQFVRSIASYQSRWDQGVALVGADASQPFPNFSDQENRGKDVFFASGCGTCHTPNSPLNPPPPGQMMPPPGDNLALFMMDEPANNGLGDPSDLGVGEITGEATDNGKFKSPSLRNVALTGPYMHDGRLETLAEVVEHYNEGVQAGPNLDPRLRDPEDPMMARRLELSVEDQAALVAFLGTLTDESVIADERWADPF